MGFIIKIIVTAIAALAAAYVLPSVTIDGIKTALIVALVLAVLNTFVKPVLVFLTLPITILTLGLFLLVINAIMVMIAAWFIDGFTVGGWITAILFSLIVTIVSFIINMFVD